MILKSDREVITTTEQNVKMKKNVAIMTPLTQASWSDKVPLYM